MQTFISKNKYFIRFSSYGKNDVQYNVLIKSIFVTNLAKQNTKIKSNITPNANFKNTKTKIKSIRKNSKNPKHKSKHEIKRKK